MKKLFCVLCILVASFANAGEEFKYQSNGSRCSVTSDVLCYDALRRLMQSNKEIEVFFLSVMDKGKESFILADIGSGAGFVSCLFSLFSRSSLGKIDEKIFNIMEMKLYDIEESFLGDAKSKIRENKQVFNNFELIKMV